MRYSTAFLSLATAAIARDASVWTPFTVTKGPAISAENARLVFAHRLGLSSYHKLATADETTLGLLDDAQKPLFSEAPKSSRKLMVIVEDATDDLLNSYPSFTISNPTNTAQNAKLVDDFLTQDAHRRGASKRGNQSPSHGAIQGGVSSNDPAGLCMLADQEWYTGMTSKEQLRILHDSTMLHEDLDLYQARQDSTAIFHVRTLSDVLAKHGVDSEEYKTLVADLRDVLTTARSSGRYTEMIVVGIPPQTKGSKQNSYGTYEMPLVARQEQPLREPAHSASASSPQATSAANRTFPKTTLSQCWSSESACKANTAQCSGHGSCRLKYSEKVSDEETGAECWACACTPTVLKSDGGSNKTIYWGGPACQKKDISVPFFLFAGFTIAALAALSYGVGLLYSIGEEDLPSVLGAGVAPPSSRK